MDNRKISLCIPTYNRFLYTVEAFRNVLQDDRLNEIIIVDDCSTDDSYDRLQRAFYRHPKVKLFRNENNLDCYLNKREAISHATNEWCILFDSDNVLDTGYIDKLYEISEWQEDVAYFPDFAKVEFSFKNYSGWYITKGNVADFINIPRFEVMLNAMNYFINKNEYLLCFDDKSNPVTSDSIFMNYNWLHSGNRIYVVPGLEYMHRIHDHSHYVLNNHRTGNFHNEVLEKIRRLK